MWENEKGNDRLIVLVFFDTLTNWDMNAILLILAITSGASLGGVIVLTYYVGELKRKIDKENR